MGATDDGFRLTLRDQPYAEAQARDILLSELAIVFPFERVGRLDPAMQDVVWNLPATDWAILGPMLRRKSKDLLFALAEPNLIAQEGMQRVFGFSYPGFYRIRATLLAYAEFALQTSAILGASSNKDNGGTGISEEALEWVLVSHDVEWFVDLLAGLSASAPAEVERFLELFMIPIERRAQNFIGGGACDEVGGLSRLVWISDRLGQRCAP